MLPKLNYLLAFELLILVVATWLAIYHLRGAWLGWQLRQGGAWVVGQVLGSRPNAGIEWRVQFQTQTGQVVTGTSLGRAWRPPVLWEGEEVVVYYEPARPRRFALGFELTIANLLIRLIAAIIAIAGATGTAVSLVEAKLVP